MSPYPPEGVATLSRSAPIGFSIIAFVLVIAAAFTSGTASGASAGSPEQADECALGLDAGWSLTIYPMNSC